MHPFFSSVFIIEGPDTSVASVNDSIFFDFEDAAVWAYFGKHVIGENFWIFLIGNKILQTLRRYIMSWFSNVEFIC